MKRARGRTLPAAAGAFAVVLGLTLSLRASSGGGVPLRTTQAAPAAATAPASSGPMTADAQRALVQKYCVTCHTDAQKPGGLTFQSFQGADHTPANIAAMMVRKLKAGQMPPPGMPRPDQATLNAFIDALQTAAIPGMAAAAAEAPAATAAAPRIIAFAHTGDRMTVAEQNRMVHTICTQCHTDQRKPGGLSFEHFDMATAPQHAEIAENMIAKLRAGMMPKASAPKRPDAASIHAFVVSLESRIDRAAANHPNPGSRTFQRLNRAEYTRAVHDLLGLTVDISAYLPDDPTSAGFDDVADVQSLSATQLDAYLSAAEHVSRLAIGDPHATPNTATYAIPRDESQMHHVEGTPFGTRGGIAFTHNFPADGSYVLQISVHGTVTDELFGNTTLYISHRDEPVIVSVNGKQVAQVEINPYMDGGENHGHGLRLDTPPIHIAAGPQHIAVSFPDRFTGPIDDLETPIQHTLADSRIGNGFGVYTLPHLDSVTVVGPDTVTGVSETPSRRLIFTCHPSAASAQQACAAQIVKRLATRAFRQPVGPKHLALLMKLYTQGAKTGGFENGVQLALQGILTDPEFLFRLETVPATVTARNAVYRVSDVDLASRLSYFLWASPPDAELMHDATAGRLHVPVVLDREVRRMLRDPKSMALSTRFAAQWLRLQDLDGITPNGLQYPEWDRSLSNAFKEETELFFNSIVHHDASVLDLLNADYTYVNGRLAEFYGIQGVAGPDFRRVSLAGTHRRGILGQGSVLLQTSLSDRTDPVLRGKWVLEVLLGQPPPPPPPGVNTNLDETAKAVSGGKALTIRQRMEEHRANPFCASCHSTIDPIGLAMENFDVTGAYRTTDDNGAPVDTSGTLYDGAKLDGLQGLDAALLRHQDTILRVFTENLMTYALGRRVEYYDMPTVRAIIHRAKVNGNRFSSFVLGIVHSDAFQMNKAQVLTAEDKR